MFEQRRCQRAATREDQARTALRLDAANALDDVRSKALERAPFKTLRTAGSDILSCRIEAVRHRTARRRWPEARPGIVGATAKHQIEDLAMLGQDCVPASGGPIGRGPVAVGEVAVVAGDLDHTVQGDVFDDLERSHLSPHVLDVNTHVSTSSRTSIYLIFTLSMSGFGLNSSPKSSTSMTLRISTSASPFGKMFGTRFTHSIASSFDFT